jgi:hypothetical protein
MKLIRSLFAATLFAAAATPAVAQFDPFSTTSSDQLHLVSSGPFSPYGTYRGQLLQSPGQPVIDIWCDDFVNHFDDNTLINVTRFDAGQTAFDTRTRFGYANLNNYMKAAYLTQFFGGLSNASDVQDLHFTIWHLLTPAQPNTVRPGEAFWLNKLNNGQWSQINPLYWFVLSDPAMINNGPTPLFPKIRGSQEFITMVAPEPSAVLLVSTGLLGIVGLARVRRRGKRQD